MAKLSRYCDMCDTFISARQTVCKACGAPTVKADKAEKVIVIADGGRCGTCDWPASTPEGDRRP